MSKTNFRPESRLAPVQGQVSCEIDGEKVILSLETGEYYGLNAVGARIWSGIESNATVAEIRDALLAEFEVDRDVCARDLDALLCELLECGLIQVPE